MTDKFVPESVLVKLVVGQRVRYVPPTDCGYVSSPKSYSAGYGATAHESYTEAEGKIGVIKRTSDLRGPADHNYLVVMDSPYRFGKKQWPNILVAAHELALVEDTA